MSTAAPGAETRGLLRRLFVIGGGTAAAAAVTLVVATPLDARNQAVFGGVLCVLALLLRRLQGRFVTLLLMGASLLASTRYIAWRLSATVSPELSADFALAALLLSAELYAWLMLVLGYLQTAAPLRRHPAPLPADPARWPTVDVYIPTYNEPLSVIRATVLAARAQDWPADKLNVWLLDDGTRQEARAFAAEAQVGYLVRETHEHAKAGNLNAALRRTRGDLIAVFDCDHVPARSFLQMTAGWFLADPKLALVQTPHHFHSIDPIRRNLGIGREQPGEDDLFYGLVQPGNDFWGASFFCGSCAVLRRSALEAIDGFAVETVTEDAHTALRLQRRGHTTAFFPIPQASGLATDTLAGHVKQRMRWARGMTQIFRIDNPLLGRGLKLPQRLCYANAMLHFLYGVPRLVFLLAPLAYLLFGAHIFNAAPALVAAFAVPHLVLATMTGSRVQGRDRRSFWSEVYESALAAWLVVPTTLALVAPRSGTFNVTAKGGMQDRDRFDAHIAAPLLVLGGLLLGGLAVGAWRLHAGTSAADVLAMNMAWAVWNLLLLAVPVAAAAERRQLRSVPRVPVRMPAMVRLADERTVCCETRDLSTEGALLSLADAIAVAPEDALTCSLFVDGAEYPLPVRVVAAKGRTLRVCFDALSTEQEAWLARALFGRADAWLEWGQARRPDRPLRELIALTGHALRGVGRVVRLTLARGAVVLLALLPLGRAEARDHGTTTTLAELGVDATVTRHHAAPVLAVPFHARRDRVLTALELELEVDSAAALAAGATGLEVRVNGEAVATLDAATLAGPDPHLLVAPAGDPPRVSLVPSADADVAPARLAPSRPAPVGLGARSSPTPGSDLRRVVLAIEPTLAAEENLLELHLHGARTARCPHRVRPGAWRLLAGGRLHARATPLPLANDLALLPLPFLDRRVDASPVVAVALLSPRDREALQAAALVGAWAGLAAGGRVRFRVYREVLPEESAVVLTTAGHPVPGLSLPLDEGPALRLVDHPLAPDKHKLLILSGLDSHDLLAVARHLAAGTALGPGAEVRFGGPPAIAPRVPYDAPRWSPPGAPVHPFAEGATQESLFGGTLRGGFRLAPDLFFWPQVDAALEVVYRAELPPGVRPTLTIELNGRYVGRVVPPGSGAHRAEVRLHRDHLRGYNGLAVHVDYGDHLCPGDGAPPARLTISPETALRVEALGHFAPLTEVSRFLHDGHPFTRLADLADTVVVLPDDPRPDELRTLLSAFAHLAAVTGVPGHRATLLSASEAEDGALVDRDVLLIGAAARLPLLGAWAEALPLRVEAGRFLVRDPDPLFAVLERLGERDPGGEVARAGEVLAREGPFAAALAAESPVTPGRGLVVLTADAEVAMPAVDELQAAAEGRARHADLLLAAGGERWLFGVSPPRHAGRIGAWTRLRWYLADRWLVLFPLTAFGCVALAGIAHGAIRRRERRRLQELDGGGSCDS